MADFAIICGMKQASLLRLTALLGAASVGLGAFAAHGLEGFVDSYQLGIFGTAVRYQFYHSLAIGLAAAFAGSRRVNRVRLGISVNCWLIGMVLFCGSLYLLSLQDYHQVPVSILGPLTPVGGLFLIVGWLALAFVPGESVKNGDQAIKS